MLRLAAALVGARGWTEPRSGKLIKPWGLNCLGVLRKIFAPADLLIGSCMGTGMSILTAEFWSRFPFQVAPVAG